jgi:hypothetical protein
MSAVGFPKTGGGFNDVLIGSHADFRLEDYVFPRTQSRSLSSLEWESRVKPMHCWGEFSVYVLAAMLVASAALVLL